MKTQSAQASIQTIEWDVVEGGNTEFQAVYPRMQWIHGDPKVQSGIMATGGLFISAEIYPSFTANGFTPQTLITDDGKRIEGYGAQTAKLAVLRIKQQWVKDAMSGKNTPLLHALVVVEGNTDIVCLSLKGASKSLPFNKAFQLHQAQNVAFANKSRPAGVAALEPFALWFPVKAGELSMISAKDGKSSSKVTSPELVKPETVDRNYAVSLWVGAANYKTFAQAFRDTADWQKQAIWKQAAETESDDLDGVINDPVLKQLIDLATIKGVDEKEFCLSLTQGETDRWEALRFSEAREALAQMKLL